MLAVAALRARGHLTGEEIRALLAEVRERPWSPLVLLLLYLVLAPLGFPMTPLILAGGAVFGFLWGWLYNFTGTCLGAASTFLLVHHLARDLVTHLAGRRLARVERLLQRHGFWTIFRLRFLPLPFALVNYGAALAGIRWPTFLGATALGMVPSMAIFTYLAAALVDIAAESRLEMARDVALAATLVVLLSFLPALWRSWRRRKRYRELREKRRRRT